MSNVQEQIEAILKGEALSASLTPETLKSFLEERAKDKAEIQCANEEVKKLEEEVIYINKQLNTTHDKLYKVELELASYQTRESELRSEEGHNLEINIRNEYERLRSDDLKETIALLLRNTEYRKSSFGTQPVVIPGHDSNGYNQMPYASSEPVSNEETFKEE